jgi:hypothetical protein
LYWAKRNNVKKLVVDDVRFDGEYKLLKENGAYFVRLCREGVPEPILNTSTFHKFLRLFIILSMTRYIYEEVALKIFDDYFISN